MRDERGWSNLCRILTLAHAHTREGPTGASGRAVVDLQAVLDHAEGLVCLTGCAERSDRQGVHDEPAARRLLDAFGPEGLYVELQRPYARHDRARNRALAALARRLGVRCVATGNVHAHARCQGRAAGCVRGAAQPRHARRLRAAAPRQPQPRDELAAGDGQPLRRPPRGGSRDAARWPSG